MRRCIGEGTRLGTGSRTIVESRTQIFCQLAQHTGSRGDEWWRDVNNKLSLQKCYHGAHTRETAFAHQSMPATSTVGSPIILRRPRASSGLLSAEWSAWRSITRQRPTFEHQLEPHQQHKSSNHRSITPCSHASFYTGSAAPSRPWLLPVL